MINEADGTYYASARQNRRVIIKESIGRIFFWEAIFSEISYATRDNRSIFGGRRAIIHHKI
jgi:hypothetical protein